MQENTYFIESTCRVCQSEALFPVVSLGNQRIVDFVDEPNESDKPIVPLELVCCNKCKLVQLRHTVFPDILFKKFWYRSGINEQMRSALQDIVTKSIAKVKLKADDLVIDIGCNDGTMLSMFPSNVKTVGFDPSNQLATAEAKSRMTYAINNYFNMQDAMYLVKRENRKAKIVTAIAMFYDIPDPMEFLIGIKEILADDGIIVIQMNYLLEMLKQNAFDNVCHEHIMYYSMTSLRWLLTRCGLDIIDVEVNDVNGGSFRAYIKKTPIQHKDIQDSFYRIKDLAEEEKTAGLDSIDTYIKFGERIKDILWKLTGYIVDLVAKGNPVYAYGASTRGTVLLNATPAPLPISGVAERDTNKFGKYMVSGWLKIYGEEYVRNRCKHMLVLPWHFKKSIVEREKAWIEDGGTLIFPMGGEFNGPHIVNKAGEKSLLKGETQDAVTCTTTIKS